MKMSYALASRYSKIFEIMQDPYALIILDYLFENRTAKTMEDLAMVAKTTKAKVTRICSELLSLSIVSRTYEGSTITFQAIDSKFGNFVEKIIEIID